jgi:hypothetical protein
MPNTFIVASFDTDAAADEAIRRLEAEGVPSNTISRHAQGQRLEDRGASAHEPSEQSAGSVWDWILGEESPVRDNSIYQRSVESGGTVIAVPVGAEHVGFVTEILRVCGPAHLEQRRRPSV